MPDSSVGSTRSYRLDFGLETQQTILDLAKFLVGEERMRRLVEAERGSAASVVDATLLGDDTVAMCVSRSIGLMHFLANQVSSGGRVLIRQRNKRTYEVILR